MMNPINIHAYQNCRLCPRECKVNRLESKITGKLGFCGESDQIRVGFVGPHFGEEPPITGQNGSGTVFLSGCSLKCCFCQNHQISHDGMGKMIAPEDLFLDVKTMINTYHVHNINFVTPDQFFPHIFQLVSRLRRNDIDLPVVFNTSGYQSVGVLQSAYEYVDIYLPDFKYSDTSLAAKFSNCPDYPQIALNAVSEMIKQKGFLDSCVNNQTIATKGVLVRHLIIPGHVENSINALTSLFIEFGRHLPLSLMSQYHPIRHHCNEGLNRSLSKSEFDAVYDHAMDLGFENMFIQYPDMDIDYQSVPSPFLPDFKEKEPFN